jgi:hypothetical protein
MPRPIKYHTDEERQQARQRQIRRAVIQNRQRKKQERTLSSSTISLPQDTQDNPSQASQGDPAQLSWPFSEQSDQDSCCWLHGTSPGQCYCRPSSGSDSHSTIHLPPSTGFNGLDEKFYASYYSTLAIKEFLSFFKSDFWERIVLQVSHIEPAVKHAMLAVACVHIARASQHSLASSSSADKPQRVQSLPPGREALLHYNTAIKHMVDRIHKDQKSGASPSRARDVWLICCALFVVLESMLGDNVTALSHMHHGLRLLQEYRDESSVQDEAGLPAHFSTHHTNGMFSDISPSKLAVKSGYYAGLHELKTVFRTFDVQATLMSLDTLSYLHILESFTPGISPTSSTLSPILTSTMTYTFHTLDDAYNAFIQLILALCSTMVSRPYEALPGSAVSADSRSSRTSNTTIHSSHFHAWAQAYAALLAGAGPNRWRSATDRLAMQLLNCQAILCQSVSASFTIPALYNRTMREMLHSIAALVRHRGSDGGGLRRDNHLQRPRLTLDIGLVVTLYGAAVLMVDSDVRLEAIELLGMVCTAPAKNA